jgi:hypothetical protein
MPVGGTTGMALWRDPILAGMVVEGNHAAADRAQASLTIANA